MPGAYERQVKDVDVKRVFGVPILQEFYAARRFRTEIHQRFFQLKVVRWVYVYVALVVPLDAVLLAGAVDVDARPARERRLYSP
jgi:hypothetical protein